jgi:exoribonuclease-2
MQRPLAGKEDLRSIARRVMRERGLEPDLPPQARREADAITRPATAEGVRDLRALLWSSIDNDDSRDLDQLTVFVPANGDDARILVAVADVDALILQHGALDAHARVNTTSVYTAAMVFPMLPEKFSTDLTSLNPDRDRLALVVDMTIDANGSVTQSDIYRAMVQNRAKLAYDGVAAWLDGDAATPAAVANVAGMDAQVRTQERIAQKLRHLRAARGALELETPEARAVFEADVLADLRPEHRNRAKDLIEDFMIAANGVTARFLASAGYTALRRVLPEPERWDRIVELAQRHGATLPDKPDARALNAFLAKRRDVDPRRFPDLSLSVVKLLGRGEYVAELPGRKAQPHFGLAVRDYTHSTAPNRRYPDLVTQRLLKAALAGERTPYPDDELVSLARHCTEQEDNAAKVERQVQKSAAALLLAPRIGERFEGVVTGASDKGTWVRIEHPMVEGRVVRGFERLDVGDHAVVELLHTDVARGFIDFACISRPT